MTLAPLRDFITAATREMAFDRPEAERLAILRGHLAALVSRDDWLPDELAQPHPEFYRQYLLHADPLERFSVVSFVWGPGQRTPVHDHTVWGLVGLLRGAERCDEYAWVDGRPQASGRSHLMAPGDIEAVSPTVGDWHRVSATLPDRPSISIHVYGANIGAVKRHRLDDAGQMIEFVSGYDSASVPNLWDRSKAGR